MPDEAGSGAVSSGRSRTNNDTGDSEPVFPSVPLSPQPGRNHPPPSVARGVAAHGDRYRPGVAAVPAFTQNVVRAPGGELGHDDTRVNVTANRAGHRNPGAIALLAGNTVDLFFLRVFHEH